MVDVVTPNMVDPLQIDALNNSDIDFIKMRIDLVARGASASVGDDVSFLVSAVSSMQQAIVNHMNGSTPQTPEDLALAKETLEQASQSLTEILQNDPTAIENALGDQTDTVLTKIANNQREFDEAVEAAQEAETNARNNLDSVKADDNADQIMVADVQDDLAAASSLASTGFDFGSIIQALIELVTGGVAQPQVQTTAPTQPDNGRPPEADGPAAAAAQEEPSATEQPSLTEAEQIAQDARLAILENGETLEYTIVPGDALSVIAGSFNASMSDIRLLNPDIPADGSIQAGQTISLPYNSAWLENATGAGVERFIDNLKVLPDAHRLAIANHVLENDIQNTSGIDINNALRNSGVLTPNGEPVLGGRGTPPPFVEVEPPVQGPPAPPPTSPWEEPSTTIGPDDIINSQVPVTPSDVPGGRGTPPPFVTPEPPATEPVEPPPITGPDEWVTPPAPEPVEPPPVQGPEKPPVEPPVEQPPVEPPHNPADDLLHPEEVLAVEELRDGKGVEHTEAYSDMDLLQDAINKVREITGDETAFAGLESKLDGGKFVQSADSVAALNAYTASYQNAITDGAITRGEYGAMLSSMLDTIDKTPDAIVADRAGIADDVKGYDRDAAQTTDANVSQIKTNMGA